MAQDMAGTALEGMSGMALEGMALADKGLA